MKRCLDLLLAATALLLLAVPLALLAALVRLTSPGPVLYWSDRVGRNNAIFRMPKFRSMRLGTPALATHLSCPSRINTSRRSAHFCENRVWMNCRSSGASLPAT